MTTATPIFPKCRLCDGERVSSFGTIPDSDFFAGRVLERPIRGGKLWRCESCSSMFRHPTLTEEAYTELYELGASDAWRSERLRNDLMLIRRYISRLGSPSVLDVGCSNGAFLRSLPDAVRKYGVEPSTAAAATATQAGICIAGRTLEDVTPNALFDVITVIDVIEHVLYPLRFLDRAAAQLAPGGTIIVATADPNNFAWRRVFRSRFWYASFPEHITFPSSGVLKLWGERHQLHATIINRVRYWHLPLRSKLMCLVQMAIFLISPRLLSAVGRSIGRRKGTPMPRKQFFSPGAPGVFADHHIISFTRKAE